MLKIVQKILKILQTDISPDQVAFGAALGVFLGLVPGILMKCFFFLLIMVLRVNIGSAFITWTIFGILGLLLDPLADKLGYFILNAGFLLKFWTFLFNIPVLPFTKFNNTIVMGNLFLGIVFFVPIVIATKKFLVYYRKNWRDKVAKWKIVRLLTAGNLSLKLFK